MGKMNLWAAAPGVRRLCASMAAILLVLGALALITPQTGLADGGGWPTATRTRRPTKTPAPSATVDLQFLFQATETPVVNAVQPVQPGLVEQPGESGQSIIGVQVPTATPQARPFSLKSLWPFFVVALIILAGGVYFLLTRMRAEVRE